METSASIREAADHAAASSSVAAADIKPGPRWQPRTVALVLIAAVATLFALRTGAAFFIPLVISIFLSYALAPLVDRLQRWHVPRAIGAAIVVMLLLVGGAAAIYRASDDAADLLEQMPQAVEKLRLALTAMRAGAPGPLEHVQRTAAELEKLAGAAAPKAPATRTPAAAPPPAIDVRSLLLIGTGSAIIALGQLFSVLFLTYFLLAAGDLFRRKVMHLAGPSLARRKVTLHIMQSVHRMNRHYFAVVLVINLTVGLAIGVAMHMIGLDRVTMWALAGAVLHTIPYLGAALLACGAGLAAYLQLGTFDAALLAMGLVLAIAALLGMGLQTWLMGRAAAMNAPAVFISLLFWGMLWGAWGLLLAVPIMVAIKTVCDNVESLKGFGTLLAP